LASVQHRKIDDTYSRPKYVIPIDTAHFDCVRYRYEGAFSEDAQAANDLVNAIQRALEKSQASGPHLPRPKFSPRQIRAQLVGRLFEAADAIRLLRINSVAEIAIGLEVIAKDLEQIPEETIVAATRETTEKFLKVFARLADQLATVRGSKMLISGIIGAVLGGAGFPGITVFALSLAFWEGREPFLGSGNGIQAEEISASLHWHPSIQQRAIPGNDALLVLG
jgi:hypothetical protein